MISHKIKLLLLGLLATSTLAIASNKTTPANIEIKNGQIKENINGLNLIVDKRIEILGIVQLLAESKMVRADNTTYANNLVEYFKPFKDHPVVAQYKKMEQKGFAYDAPVHTMLFLDENLKIVKDIDKPLIKRGSGKKQIKKFIDLLQDFDKESKFDDFFKNNAELLHKSIQLLIDSSFQHSSAIPTLEDFYGYKQNSYNIILASLFNGGYGPKMKAENGMYDIYDIQGAWEKPVNSIPFFGNANTFSYIQWHEFSHSFVNPLVDEHLKEFEKYKSLFDPISKKMSAMAYGQWRICLYEHIVRAITTVLTYHAYGEEKALQELEEEHAKGFIYIDKIYSTILDYSKNNKKEMNFKEFFPEILNVMEYYIKNPVEYNYLPVPNEVYSTSGEFVMIYSTQEIVDSMNVAIRNYAETINRKFFKLPDTNFMADTSALKKDLKNYNVICYGSYKGNKWLKTKITDLPFTISDNKIEGNKAYEQDDLILIADWQNPDNPEKTVIIYTAQNPAQVVNINSVMHGSSNWLIADENFNIIDYGNYKFKEGKFAF